VKHHIDPKNLPSKPFHPNESLFKVETLSVLLIRGECNRILRLI